MGTMGDRNVKGQQAENTGKNVSQGSNVSQGPSVGSPISNEAYNLITALQAKLEGLEAYRKYQKDGSGQIWQELSQSDVQCVSRLLDELETMVKDGKLRGQIQGQQSQH